MRKLIIGTRGSKLALWQAELVKYLLKKRYHTIEIELKIIKTKGDKIIDVPLAKVGGKGLFVKEIENELQEKKIDLAVHSLKDVPAELPDDLHLQSIMKRENPYDALISKDGKQLDDLPEGASVGTSSLRRKAQIKDYRKDLVIEDLRGNLDTRLKKLYQGTFDAIILAAAGLVRMGWEDKISQYLSPTICLPAIGQGALGIETRKDDIETNQIVSTLNDEETATIVRAERGFLKRLLGGCQVPIAAFCTLSHDTLTLQGLVGKTDGSKILKDEIIGDIHHPEDLGTTLAERLLHKGAREILEEVYGKTL
ncbi:MAG: hydroxymethylbilane synthase [Thermodesulfobacteriota bacterium]|nr:hydroxymethylbilane synthase [Thermodesulfobacteriota bacterium]